MTRSENRGGLLHRVLERKDPGHLERESGRIHLVEGAVHDAHDDVDDGKARHDAVVAAFHDAFGGWLDELLRNRAADDLVDDLDALALDVRLELDAHMAVLALAAGLPDKLALAVGCLGDGFAISDLRLAGGRLDLELALHPVANDVEVELAHPRENRLTGVLIRFDAKGRILRHQALEGHAHFFLVGLRVRLDGHRNDGLREGRRLQANVEILIAQRIARDDILHADDAQMSPA